MVVPLPKTKYCARSSAYEESYRHRTKEMLLGKDLATTQARALGSPLNLHSVQRDDNVIRFVVDATNLKTIRVEKADLYPPIIEEKTLAATKHILSVNNITLEHHVFQDQGDKSDNGTHYYLSWQSQPGDRDQAHSSISDPSTLLLHEIKV